MTEQNIKYIYIGNIETKHKIGEYPNTYDQSINDTISKIYEKGLSSSSNVNEVVKFGSANKNEDTYLLMNSSIKVLYLIITDQNYKKEFVIQIFNELEKQLVHTLTDSSGNLNETGKRILKDIVKKYETKKNTLQEISSDIDQVKIELQKNIKQQLGNNDNAEILSNTASKLKDRADLFKKDASKLQRITCWQNCKWTLILVIVMIALIIIIVVPILVNSSGKSDDSKNNDSNHSEPPKSGDKTMRFLMDKLRRI